MGSTRVSYRTALTQGQGDEGPSCGQQPNIMHALKTVHSAGHHGLGELHPFQCTEGEKFPPGCFRNSEGLLVRGEASFTVMGDDLVVLEREIRFLKIMLSLRARWTVTLQRRER